MLREWQGWVIGLWIGWLAGSGAGPSLRASALSPEGPATRVTVILVTGAGGQKEYGEAFAHWTSRWQEAAERGGAEVKVVGRDQEPGASDRERLEGLLSAEPKEGTAELWLVLLVHGTFDGRQAKFNLRGPDFSAADLAVWLRPFRRPLVLINTASASAPYINELSAPGRVIVTATRSGSEQNYARFGESISRTITDEGADLDKDGQISVLEAFLMASRGVAEWYELEGRLATEHALLDDNGDGLGTPPDWFRGVHAVKQPKTGGNADGLRAHQVHLIQSERERTWPPERRARRDELELAIARLRGSKATLQEDEYYRLLEELLLEMAQLYEVTEGAP